MSKDVVDRMLKIVQDEQQGWQDRAPQLAQRIGIGGGGTCPWYYDEFERKAKRATETECIRAFKVIDTSPVKSTTPPISNSDCAPKFESIRILWLGIETLKHSRVGGTDLFFPEQIPFAVELGRLYRDDPKCFIPTGNCPVSPLTVSKTIADLAVAKAPYGVNYGVPTMPIAGANAPITPSGTAVIGVAEILGGYVLAKALNPQNPVSATALSARVDFRTGEITYLAPEVFAADVAIAEVMKHCLGLSCGLFGIYIDAKLPGMRAVYEKLMRSLALGLYGNLSGFEGTLNHGKVFSYTQLMLDCDLHSHIATYTKEAAVEDDDLAVEEILKLGWDSPGYMIAEHTLHRMRRGWQSSICAGPGETEEQTLQRACERWQENLKHYEPPDHSNEFLKDLRAIGEQARMTLSG